MTEQTLRSKVPIIQGEWGVMCENCKYVRKFGKAQFAAKRAARQHAHRYADHIVCVTQTVIVERWGGYTPQLQDDSVADPPPF